MKPFRIELSDQIHRLNRLVEDTRLPDEPEYPRLADSFGFDLDYLKGECSKQVNVLGAQLSLKAMQSLWIKEFNWNTEQDELNKSASYFSASER